MSASVRTAPEVHSPAAARVVVSGATKNFFKVGHTTLRRLSREHPEVKLRLGVPNVPDARTACEGMEIELVQWTVEDPPTLEPVLDGATALLMVPPIQNRVEIARTYIRAARRVGIGYILCLAVQHHDPRLRIAGEAEQVTEMLETSGIEHDVLHLPMFLENLLYQVPSVRDHGRLRYPADPDARFSYVTCGDLGEIAARVLADPAARPALGDTHWTAAAQTSCSEIARLLSEATGTPVAFERQPDGEFVRGLVEHGMTERSALGVLELWHEINAGRDLPANAHFAEILGRAPESAEQWITAHRCCFAAGAARCRHPQPPPEHAY